MPAIYNPSPVAITNLTFPIDGELASAISIVDPVERVADGVKYIQDGIDGTTPGILTPQDINVAGGSFDADAVQVTCGVPCVTPAGIINNGTLTQNGTLNASGTSNLATVNISGTTNAAGVNVTSLTRSGCLSVTGSDITFGKKQFFNAPSVYRFTTAVGDANQSIDPANTDIFDVVAATFTAPRDGTIANGTDVGQVIRVCSHDSNLMNMKNFSGSTIKDFNNVAVKITGLVGGAGQYSSALFVWAGSIWYMVGQ